MRSHSLNTTSLDFYRIAGYLLNTSCSDPALPTGLVKYSLIVNSLIIQIKAQMKPVGNNFKDDLRLIVLRFVVYK